AVCRARLVDPAEADDATVLTLVSLLQTVQRIDPERPLIPYVATIARHLCGAISQQRRTTVTILSLEALCDNNDRACQGLTAGCWSDPVVSFQIAETRMTIQRCLATIPEEYRLLLEYHYGLGISTSQLHQYWPEDLQRWNSRASLFRWLKKARAIL